MISHALGAVGVALTLLLVAAMPAAAVPTAWRSWGVSTLPLNQAKPTNEVPTQVVGEHGRIYAATNYANLVAFDGATGALAWNFSSFQSVAAADRPVLAFTIMDDVLYYIQAGEIGALNATTGAQLWFDVKQQGKVWTGHSVLWNTTHALVSNVDVIFVVELATGALEPLVVPGEEIVDMGMTFGTVANDIVLIVATRSNIRGYNSTFDAVYRTPVSPQPAQVAFYPSAGGRFDGTDAVIFVASAGGAIVAMSASTGAVMWNVASVSSKVTSWAISFDQATPRVVLAVVTKNSIRVFDAADGNLLGTGVNPAGTSGDIAAAFFDHETNLFFVTDKQSNFAAYDILTMTFNWTTPAVYTTTAESQAPKDLQLINGMLYMFQTRSVPGASPTPNSYVVGLNPSTGHPRVQFFTGNADVIATLCLNPAGRGGLVVAAAKGALYNIDINGAAAPGPWRSYAYTTGTGSGLQGKPVRDFMTGNVYVIPQPGVFAAFDPHGHLLFNTTIQTTYSVRETTPPRIVGDRVLYALGSGSSDTRIMIMNKTNGDVIALMPVRDATSMSSGSCPSTATFTEFVLDEYTWDVYFNGGSSIFRLSPDNKMVCTGALVNSDTVTQPSFSRDFVYAASSSSGRNIIRGIPKSNFGTTAFVIDLGGPSQLHIYAPTYGTDAFYTLTNSGNLSAWGVSTGVHIWSYQFPPQLVGGQSPYVTFGYDRIWVVMNGYVSAFAQARYDSLTCKHIFTTHVSPGTADLGMPSVADDGTVFFANVDGLASVSWHGTLLWSNPALYPCSDPHTANGVGYALCKREDSGNMAVFAFDLWRGNYVAQAGSNVRAHLAHDNWVYFWEGGYMNVAKFGAWAPYTREILPPPLPRPPQAPFSLEPNSDSALRGLTHRFTRRMDGFKAATFTLGHSYISEGITCWDAAKNMDTTHFLQSVLGVQEAFEDDVVYAYISYEIPNSGGKWGDCGCIYNDNAVQCYYLDETLTYHEFNGANFNDVILTDHDASTEGFEYTQAIRNLTQEDVNGKWLFPFPYQDPSSNISYQLMTFSVPLAFDPINGHCTLGVSIDINFAAVQRWLAHSHTDVNAEILLIDHRSPGALIASSVQFDYSDITPPTETPYPRINHFVEHVMCALGPQALHQRGTLVADGMLHRIEVVEVFTFLERAPLLAATKPVTAAVETLLLGYEQATEVLGRAYLNEDVACYEMAKAETTTQFLHAVHSLQQAYGSQIVYAYASYEIPNSGGKWGDCGCAYNEGGPLFCSFIDRDGVEHAFEGANFSRHTSSRVNASTEGYDYTQVIRGMTRDNTHMYHGIRGLWHAPYVYLDPYTNEPMELMTFSTPLAFDEVTGKCTLGMSVDFSMSLMSHMLRGASASYNTQTALFYVTEHGADFVAASVDVQLGGNVFAFNATPSGVVNHIGNVAYQLVSEAHLFEACHAAWHQWHHWHHHSSSSANESHDHGHHAHDHPEAGLPQMPNMPCHLAAPRGPWIYNVEIFYSYVLVTMTPASDTHLPIDATVRPGVAPATTGRVEKLWAAAATLDVRAHSWMHVTAALNNSYYNEMQTCYDALNLGNTSLFLEQVLATQQAYREEIVYAYASYELPNSGGKWGDCGCMYDAGHVFCYTTLANGTHLTFNATDFSQVHVSPDETFEEHDYSKVIMSLTRENMDGFWHTPYHYTDPVTKHNFSLITFSLPQKFNEEGKCILAVSVDISFTHLADHLAHFKTTANSEIVLYDTRGDGTFIASSAGTQFSDVHTLGSIPNQRLQGYFGAIWNATGSWSGGHHHHHHHHHQSSTFSYDGMTYTVIPVLGLWAVAQRSPNAVPTHNAAVDVDGLFGEYMVAGYATGRVYVNEGVTCYDAAASGNTSAFLHFVNSLQTIAGSSIQYLYVSYEMPGTDGKWGECGCSYSPTSPVECYYIDRDGTEHNFQGANFSESTGKRLNASAEGWDYSLVIQNMTHRDVYTGVWHAPYTYENPFTGRNSTLVTWSYPIAFDASGRCTVGVSVDFTLDVLGDVLSNHLDSGLSTLFATWSEGSGLFMAGTNQSANGTVYPATETPFELINDLTNATLANFGSLAVTNSAPIGSEWLLNVNAFGYYLTPFSIIGATPTAQVQPDNGTYAPAVPPVGPSPTDAPASGSPIPTIPTPSGSPIPTGVPTPSGGPIPTGIPTPSPRGTPPQNSAYITFTSSVSYSTAESRVTSALCGGSCNSNMPVTISGMTPEQTTGVEWTATFNDSSLLYNMLAVPLDRLVYYDMVEVYPGELPAISERGENQLRVQRRTSSYTSFDPFRWSVASSFLGDTTRWREIKLVNATYENCPRWGSSGCDMTFVVSFETLSPQVELAGINWERAENYRTVVSLKITNATYYPDPHADLDETSARRLGNRVELQFTYSSGSIMYYNHFATLVRSAIVADVTVEPQVTDLDASSIMLVRANVTSTGLHSTEQRYIISFPRAAQQEKLLAMHEAGTLQTYLSSVTLNEVQRAASPPGADGDGDKKKTSRAALIGGVIAAVVVVLVIVAIVGKKQTGTGVKAAPINDQELLHTPANTV